jgi:hypothetical protein
MRWDRTTRAAREAPPAPAQTTGVSLEVAPTRVATRGSGAGILVAIAMTIAFGLAIAKPWAGPAIEAPRFAEAQDGVRPPPEAVPRPTPEARRVIGGAVTPAVRGLRIADWSRLAREADDLANQPIISSRDLGGSDGDGTCGGSARVTPFDELIALSAPPGERVASARLFPIDTIRRRDIPIRIVDGRPGPLDGRTIDGLTLIALPTGGIAARQYALVADTVGPGGPSSWTWTVCVG